MDAFTHRDGELFAEGVALFDSAALPPVGDFERKGLGVIAAAIDMSRRETIEDLYAGESLLSR